ncbi:MAG TPA: GerMN domain-containing protein [Acidimicrobiales bacterium]|nr:GerMN domain-containing protein [Acidimicrobiales bacterium]
MTLVTLLSRRPRRPVTRRMVALAAALGAVAGLAACGVPTGPPQGIPPSQVPFQLVSPNPPVTTTSIIPSAVPFYIYLFNSNLTLTQYPRFLNVKVAGLTSILETLVTGPSALEAQSGVTTSIPGDTRVLSVSAPVNKVVTVDFGNALSRVTGASQVQAVEQIVFTIDNAQPSTGVLFEIDGSAIEVPKGNGGSTAGPVTVADYPGATTATTTTAPGG